MYLKSIMTKKLLCAMVLIQLLVSLTPVNTTNGGQRSTNALLMPCVVWDPALEIGDTFEVYYYVDYINKLQVYQIELGESDFDIPGWDPSVLHLVSVENGPFLGSKGATVEFFPGTIDNDLGALTLTIGGISQKFPTGGGVLAILTFEIVGDGCTPIEFGMDSGLYNATPAPGHWVVRGTQNPENLKDGFFVEPGPGPQLELQHGVSGVWEEYQAILVGNPQTSYCRVRNYGDVGAWVQIDFIIIGPDGIMTKTSDPAWVDPRIKVGNKNPPGETDVSVTYTPGPPGKYWVYAVLYFKAGCMEEMSPYKCVEATLGGQGSGKPTNTAFTVKTHM